VDGCFIILRVQTVQADIAPRQQVGANAIECSGTKAKLVVSTIVTVDPALPRALRALRRPPQSEGRNTDGWWRSSLPVHCAARSSPDWTMRKLGTVMAICSSPPRPLRLYSCARRHGRNPRQCWSRAIVGIARYLEVSGYTRAVANAEAAKYSGHSGRVGRYTAAAEAGIAIESVAALARHESLNVAQKYTRKADQLKRAPSKNPVLAI